MRSGLIRQQQAALQPSCDIRLPLLSQAPRPQMKPYPSRHRKTVVAPVRPSAGARGHHPDARQTIGLVSIAVPSTKSSEKSTDALSRCIAACTSKRCSSKACNALKPIQIEPLASSRDDNVVSFTVSLVRAAAAFSSNARRANGATVNCFEPLSRVFNDHDQQQAMPAMRTAFGRDRALDERIAFGDERFDQRRWLPELRVIERVLLEFFTSARR